MGEWNKATAVKYWKAKGPRYMREYRAGRAKKRAYRAQERHLGRVLQGLDFENFLDVGCGFGRVARLIGERATGFGLDLSLDQLRRAKGFAGGHGWARGDAESLPFRDAVFDLVLATEVLMHVPPENVRSALGEMVRVARRHVVNLDWYAPNTEMTELNWSHDYAAAYALLDVPVQMQRIRGVPQAIFLGSKE